MTYLARPLSWPVSILCCLFNKVRNTPASVSRERNRGRATMRPALLHMTILPWLCFIGGCASIFNYAPPVSATAKIGAIRDTATAAKVAGEYADSYANRVIALANTPQFFEVPIIGTALASGALLTATTPDTGTITKVLIATGALSAYEVYYAPRKRLEVYQAGENAMRCVQAAAASFDDATSEEAQRGFQAFSSATTGAQAGTFRGFSVVSTNALARTAFDQLSNVYENRVGAIVDAMSQINTRIVTRGVEASATPDASKIAADLKKAIEESRNLKDQATGAVTQMAIEKGQSPAIVGDVLQSPAFAATIALPESLATCIAKAG